MPGLAPAYLVYSGSDVVLSVTGPEQLAFYQLEPNGDYVLIDLTHPGFIVLSGSDYTINDVGPAGAILIASGADIIISTDLTATPAADIYYDIAGEPWIVLRDANRLRAVQVRGDTFLY